MSTLSTLPTAQPGTDRILRRRRIRRTWGQPWLYLPLAGALLLMIAPFLWMLSGSFKPEADIRRVPAVLIPTAPTTANYGELFSRLDFTTHVRQLRDRGPRRHCGEPLFCSMLGYALAKLEFRGQRAVFTLVMGTLMVPGPGHLRSAVRAGVQHAADRVHARADPAVPGRPVRGVPDAAVHLHPARRTHRRRPRRRLRELAIFAKIILPLTKPALATLGIITFLGSWNNFLWPLVVAQNEGQYTLPVGLALASSGQSFTRFGILLAGAVVVLLPVMIVFLLFQRQFVAGIATTGLK